MHYKNFVNATYAPAQYLQNSPIEKIKADIEKVGRYVKLDKIYLETFRDEVLVEREKMNAAKALFCENGFTVAGGITPTRKGALMGSMCYTDPDARKLLGDVAAYTAELFDEVILDDFYFTNCRCERCIKEKGLRTWARFRLDLMNDISENVVIKRAKEANPKVKMVIKYPNWYESYQDAGYNPEDEPKMFDGIYTGTETRDPHYTHQNLQRYLSYFLPRLMENIKPGQNGGGWFDLFECSLDDYVQQAYLTMFAKCRENMMFCFPLMARFPSAYMAAVGAVFDDADELIGQLGEPRGIACYKPYHSHGERHLYDFIGMLGIPLEPHPEYPTGAPVIILTADAAWDSGIVDKIRHSLLRGSRVLITSGLYKALENRGIEDILPLEVTDKRGVSDVFTNFAHTGASSGAVGARGAVTLPHLAYSTNDIWSLSAAQAPYYSHPLLLCGDYGRGRLYVLAVPDLPSDLYKLPDETLTLIRSELRVPVLLEGPARIGLFIYDNDTFILQSFAERPTNVRFRIGLSDVEVQPLTGVAASSARSGEGESVFEVLLAPGWYAAFRVKAGDEDFKVFTPNCCQKSATGGGQPTGEQSAAL